MRGLNRSALLKFALVKPASGEVEMERKNGCDLDWSLCRVPESLYKGALAGLPPAVTGSIGKGVGAASASLCGQDACMPSKSIHPIRASWL